MSRIAVFGAGYVGLVTGACLAELGHDVVVRDILPERIETLRRGEVPIYEPGLDELVAKQVAAGRLRFTTSVEEVATFGDVHFLCVGTPQRPGSHAADLRAVDSVVDALAPLLSRPTLVVGKSTVPVGTAAGLGERLRSAAPAGEEDGKVKTVVRDQPKVGRNEPCPCGSGKKYKKCHGANA